MARIAILSGNHLCHNPRVIKEASALAARHEVTVLGAWLDPTLKERDQALLRGAAFRFLPVIDLTARGFRGSLARLRCRARVKAAQTAFRYFGTQSRSQLGYAAKALCAAALQTPAELYIAHSEAALAAAGMLLEGQRRVGVDMEDWFSEDLPPAQRAARPLRMLRELERSVLRLSAHSTCPSRAMSEALASEYGCRPPLVVYNAFPWADRARLDGRRLDRPDSTTPSIHWVSQTLGPGRGLEDLIAALPMLKHPVQLHLRGAPAQGFENWLGERLPAPWRARVFLHRLVPNDELLSRIAEHDIGFAGEQDYCRSRNLTVTNKILHYLCAGLAVVASATAGQVEVAALAPGAVSLYAPGDCRALADRIDQLSRDPAALARARQAARAAAERALCWETQAAALVSSAEHAIARAADR
jgi:glycosyltransferase involved in cell wall biosynthesis